MIAIIDYGMGNLRSVEKAFNHIGSNTIVTNSPKEIQNANKVVLPGVGAYADAISCLKESGLDQVIRNVIRDNKPFLGICLGLQLLFDSSEENGGVEGLIKKINTNLKIPHMGWNKLNFNSSNLLFKGLSDNTYVYFVHSYYLEAEDKSIVIAKTNYGKDIEISVNKDNIFLTQFHPEKSGETGLTILKNFINV